MLQQTDITVTFNPSAYTSSKSLGYGQVNVCGIVIAYSVLPSPYNLGFFVSYPSKPVIKNGVQEKEANGRPKYFNEVYVADQNTRSMIDEAILNAMLNKGVDPRATQGGHTPQSAQAPTSFNAHQYTNGSVNVSSPSSFTPPSHSSAVNIAGSSITNKDDLPF